MTKDPEFPLNDARLAVRDPSPSTKNIFSGPIEQLSDDQYCETMRKFSRAPEPKNFPKPGTPEGDALARWYDTPGRYAGD